MKTVTWFGTLTISESCEVEECCLLEKDPERLAEHMLLAVENEGLPTHGLDLRELAIDCGFVELDEDYDVLLREVCIIAAKHQISMTDTDDKRIIQAVEAMDDIDKAANELSERLSEWYGAYFPELELTAESMARFVARFGSRENVPEDHNMFTKASSSMGAELSLVDECLLRNFAASLCGVYDTRKQLEQYIMSNMGAVAPNLTNIAGAPLGARLISLAGGLDKLAAFPSSTVQVIGATSALFKHLRSRAPSPKHGVIFNHPLIKGSPWWQRGKIARALAAKISLAVRMDVYGGKPDPSIKENLERKVEAIRKAHPGPPKKQSTKVTKPGPGRVGGRPAKKRGGQKKGGMNKGSKSTGDRSGGRPA
ncbi:NOP5/NOP56 family protein [Methanomethylovorans sp.]|uniref:NOP5/NOP56 family protein n=1 Tax=Methanomethylovorans sp. TaxID=2758717 RepID=UPI00351C4899